MNPFKYYKKSSQLKKNVFSGTIYSVFNMLLVFISYPIFLHYLGTELYGLWAALSIIITFSDLGDLGINGALVKFISEEKGKKNYTAIKEYFTTAVFILMPPAILIISSLFFLRGWISNLLGLTGGFFTIGYNIIPFIGILSFFIIYVNIVKGTVNGLGRIDKSNYYWMIARIIQIASSILFIILGFGIWGLLLGACLSYLFALFAFLFMIRVQFKIKIFSFNAFKLSRLKTIFKFGGNITFIKVLVMLVNPFNKIIISRYIGLSEVTFYEIAVKGVFMLQGVFNYGLSALIPEISEIQGRNKDVLEKIKKIYNKTTKLILIAALPAFIGLFIFGGIFLKIWLGGNYNELILFGMRVMLIGIFFNLLSVPIYYTFMGLNLVKYCLYNHIIQVVINVVAILALIYFSAISFKLVFIITSVSLLAAGIFLIILFQIFLKNSVVKIHV